MQELEGARPSCAFCTVRLECRAWRTCARMDAKLIAFCQAKTKRGVVRTLIFNKAITEARQVPWRCDAGRLLRTPSLGPAARRPTREGGEALEVLSGADSLEIASRTARPAPTPARNKRPLPASPISRLSEKPTMH